MDKNELLDLMDIEKGEDLKYFESIADLFETDEGYTSEDLFDALKGADVGLIKEFIESYFNQMQEFIPAEETEFYTLFENLKKELYGLAETCESECEGEEYDKAFMDLMDEIVRFHDWYVDGSLVGCVNDETGEEEVISVRDSLFRVRAEQFTDESYRFDFTDALDYELSEYVMQFSDLMDMIN
ncbi:MAG: hypothetical protein IJH41_00500 [Eubacterium sp.]|nr:hypothetical protein [Eubacterium sp.]